MSLYDSFNTLRSERLFRASVAMADCPDLLREFILRHRKSHPDNSPELQTMPYAEFLETDYWDQLRRAVLRITGIMCWRCRRRDVEVHIHHKTYAHRGREIYFPEDLEVLCKECHEKEHGREAQPTEDPEGLGRK